MIFFQTRLQKLFYFHSLIFRVTPPNALQMPVMCVTTNAKLLPKDHGASRAIQFKVASVATRGHYVIQIQAVSYGHFWVHSHTQSRFCDNVHCPCYKKASMGIMCWNICGSMKAMLRCSSMTLDSSPDDRWHKSACSVFQRRVSSLTWEIWSLTALWVWETWPHPLPERRA